MAINLSISLNHGQVLNCISKPSVVYTSEIFPKSLLIPLRKVLTHSDILVHHD